MAWQRSGSAPRVTLANAACRARTWIVMEVLLRAMRVGGILGTGCGSAVHQRGGAWVSRARQASAVTPRPRTWSASQQRHSRCVPEHRHWVQALLPLGALLDSFLVQVQHCRQRHLLLPRYLHTLWRRIAAPRAPHQPVSRCTGVRCAQWHGARDKERGRGGGGCATHSGPRWSSAPAPPAAVGASCAASRTPGTTPTPPARPPSAQTRSAPRRR